MTTLVCVSIMVQDAEEALVDARAAKQAGADLVEFRIDGWYTGQGDDTALRAEQDAAATLAAQSPLPCIVTCRSASEGGMYDGPEDARVSLYERLGTAFGTLDDGHTQHPPRYLDFELAAYARSANIRRKINLAVDHPEQIRDVRTSLILSVHDFTGRPHDLTRRLLDLRSHEAAKIHKIAWRARSLRDNLEVFDLLHERDRPMIALGMGEFGLMSRVLAPKFGGFLTFASLRPTEATAPGQPTLAELLNLYRFRAITPTTRVYGVAAWPVAHSLSPRVHNAAFEAINFDAVYLPMPIAEGYESFKATVLELIHHPRLDLGGLSVSIPHKENLARLAREQYWLLDATSAATGSANTLSVERAGGRLSSVNVSNTDAPALVGAIQRGIGPIEGISAAILGAGGLGRVAAWALAQAGARVVIYNRHDDRARDAARELVSVGENLQIDAGVWVDRAAKGHDLYVNCTSVGMTGGPDPEGTPVDPAVVAGVNPHAAYFDSVYTPRETSMLAKAREARCAAIEGLGMFTRQAELQFQTWTGASPAGLFEQLVKSAVRRAEDRP